MDSTEAAFAPLAAVVNTKGHMVQFKLFARQGPWGSSETIQTRGESHGRPTDL